MAKIKITQVKSKIGANARQKRVLEALGLRKLHATVEHDDNPVIRGMVEKVRHLLRVDE